MIRYLQFLLCIAACAVAFGSLAGAPYNQPLPAVTTAVAIAAIIRFRGGGGRT